jgi:hypothetical protein
MKKACNSKRGRKDERDERGKTGEEERGMKEGRI